MNKDVELIRAFDPSARFYRSAVDGTLCVEFRQAWPTGRSTATAAGYADFIRHFKAKGW